MDPTVPSASIPSRPGISRRQFAATAAGTVSVLAGAAGLTIPSIYPARAADARLPIPDLLTPTRCGGASVFTLRASPGDHEVLPGVRSATAGFNGPFLGPTVRWHNGQRVRMKVENNLDEDLAVHWHGAHVPPEADGGVESAFGPGEVWRAEFTVKQDAASLWYHPHTMGRTARQLSWGMAGLIIVNDDSHASAVLPRQYGVDDIPVIMQCLAVGSDGDIKCDAAGFDSYGVRFPVLVNGVRLGRRAPVFTVDAPRVRLRLLNASISDVLTVTRADGGRLTQIATESGYLTGPTRVDSVRLVGARRSEIVVGVAEPVLLQVTVHSAGGQGGSGTYPLLRLLPGSSGRSESSDGSSPAARLPGGRLNTITRYRTAGLPVRTVALTVRHGHQGIGGVSATTMEAMEARMIEVKLGDTEVWDVVNTTRQNHSFHVHDVHFQIVSIDGEEPTGVDLGWRDTVEVPAGVTVRIALHFTDYASETHMYMLHCHMAQHEDRGMMTFLKVRP
jgi:FtsP/CotA-like multicopper oxidase with cupredoxin domain